MTGVSSHDESGSVRLLGDGATLQSAQGGVISPLRAGGFCQHVARTISDSRQGRRGCRVTPLGSAPARYPGWRRLGGQGIELVMGVGELFGDQLEAGDR